MNQAQLNIRFARVSDESIIFDLIRGLAEYENLSHAVEATPELLKAALFSHQPWAEAILAERNGKPVGFALFFHNFSTFTGRRGLYLEDLFVEQQARGQGIGKALLSFLAKLARERGCGRMEWSVLEWNAAAIAFYQSLGADPLHEWTTYRLNQQAFQGLLQSADST